LTVDLAASLAGPAPVLRRVADLELARTQLVDELAQMRQQRELQVRATTVDDEQVRGLLRRLFDELCDLPHDEEARRTHARRALAEVLERIVLDPFNLAVQPHYAVQTGVILASPRRDNLSPVIRRRGQPARLKRRGNLSERAETDL
jgi:hypothetical protein